MKPKKTYVITFRVTEEIKKKIEKVCNEKEWSQAKVIEKIVNEYFKDPT